MFLMRTTFKFIKNSWLIRPISSCAVYDGKEASQTILNDLREKVDKWVSSGHRVPQLSVVIVGEDPASLSYIRIKSKAAKQQLTVTASALLSTAGPFGLWVKPLNHRIDGSKPKCSSWDKPAVHIRSAGISSEVIKMKTETTQSELIHVIEKLNNDENVDGILIQLPLPSHLDEHTVNNTISPGKDVDGFTQTNMGRLCMNSSLFIPCTAMAVYHIIENIGIETKGKHALVCGRSKHIGLPIVLMLHSSRYVGDTKGLNMTTTLCHRHTPRDQLKTLAQNSDFIISAAGVPGLISGDMIKEGAVVIDVGMTRIHNEGSKATFIGDVIFDEVKEKASHITPVPGGVGPLTVAMLIENTLKAAQLNSNCQKSY